MFDSFIWAFIRWFSNLPDIDSLSLYFISTRMSFELATDEVLGKIFNLLSKEKNQ
jgi:hypothetical protein